MNTIKLKCNECGGIMDRDENRPILYCPYCGSKELVEESDDVTKARIEASTRLKMHEQKLKHEEELERIEVKNNNDVMKIGIGIFVAAVIFFIFTIVIAVIM